MLLIWQIAAHFGRILDTLKQAEESFKKLHCTDKLVEIFYLQARIFDQLEGQTKARDEAAKRFRMATGLQSQTNAGSHGNFYHVDEQTLHREIENFLQLDKVFQQL